MSIPASKLVNVIPSVLSPGGNSLSLNAVFLTNSTRVPVGTVQAFSSLEDVQDFFGPTSIEATLAAIYFAGYNGATTLPGTLYFAQYNSSAVAAYLRSGSFAGVTLTELQGLSGVLTLTVDGDPLTTATINLSSASSFSNAASLIQTALHTVIAGTTCTYDSQLQAFVITSPTTGGASTITFATGTLSEGLKLTASTGAVLSQGAAPAVPAAFMSNVAEATQNWATFMTCFSLTTDELLDFAQWVQTTNQRYAFVGWDSDATVLAGPSPTSFGAQAVAADMVGLFPIYEPADDNGNGRKAAFVCGTVASINFARQNGRITFAYKGQPGLVADITSATVADNLKGNGYNFYAAYATANDRFVMLQPGSTPGPWNWFDAYVNQIWLNSELQLAFMNLLTQVPAVPYNAEGYNLLRQAANDPIQRALFAGVIQPGVSLSNAQRAQVNSAAGINIADSLQNNGYYLQILDAPPEVRAQRGSPPMTLWYTDGGSIQNIELASINVQ